MDLILITFYLSYLKLYSFLSSSNTCLRFSFRDIERLKTLTVLQHSMKSRDYMKLYVNCERDGYLTFIVFIPLTPNAYIARSQTCPCCNETAKIENAGYIFNIVYEIIEDKELLRWHSKNKPAGSIIYSVRCVSCEDLSFIESYTNKWDENLEISLCPICGSDEIEVKKFDVYLDKQSKPFSIEDKISSAEN